MYTSEYTCEYIVSIEEVHQHSTPLDREKQESSAETFSTIIPAAQVEIIGLTPELDGLVSPITSLVINTVKRDLQNLVTPLLREMLEEQIKENAPSDVSELFG